MDDHAGIFKLFPEVKDAWDYEKNTVSPESIKPSSNMDVNWKCEHGHSFKRSVHQYLYKTRTCPICEKKKSMVAGKPYLMKFWDKEKNTLDPETTSVKSAETAYWKCPDCGYEWITTVRGRNNSKKRDLCPCCGTNSVVKQGVNDFATVYPELGLDALQELNPDVDLGQEGVGSHKRIKWRCHVCGYEWEAPIYGRIRRDSKPYRVAKCPACANGWHTKSFSEEYPGLVKLYSKNNKVPLDEIDRDWQKKYLWTCEKHGDFTASLSSVIRAIGTGNNGCPYCHGIKVKREESFGAKHPELLKEWSDQNTVSPYEIPENSKYEAIWTCDKGHVWKASVYTRVQGYGYCRQCYPFGKTHTAFYETHPKLKKYYSKKNTTLFEMHSVSDDTPVLWHCDEGHEFEDSCLNISKRGFRCPICEGRKALTGYNDFETKFPQYAKYYDNERNEKKACEILPNSSDPNTWWHCDKGHSFQKPVAIFIEQKGVCPVCSRYVLQQGENDALTKYPELGKLWDYDANTKRPEEVFDTSKSYFNFACGKGHLFTASIQQMAAHGFKCLICENVRLAPDANSLQAVNPALASEWADDNDRDADTVMPSSTYVAKWVCPKCGGEYQKAVRGRSVGDDSCPYCAQKQLLVGYNDLTTADADLASEWAESNEISASEVMRNQHYKAKWICPTCGGEYSAYVDEREVGDDSCPFCNNQELLVGFNDFQTVHPDLSEEWSSENEIKPNEVLASTHKRIHWKCKNCHGDYYANASARVDGTYSCPYCSGQQLLEGYNDLKTVRPDLAAEWSPDNDASPSDYLPTSAEYAQWVCPECHGKYSTVIRKRVSGEVSCPYCAGKETLVGYNDLATTDPDLAKEWSPNNSRDITSVRKDLSLNALWICPVCHGEYHAEIRDREVGDDACPYCSGRATLQGYNDLATTDPDLAKEWSSNNELKATQVRKSLKYIALWKCPTCHGEYHAMICDREVGDDSCPYCKGDMTLQGYNDLATTDPELAKEWSQNNELKVTNVRKELRTRVNWICPACGNEYSARICDREVGDNYCPFCSGRITREGVNDLATTDPKLAKEWSPNNDREVTTVQKSFTFFARWICPTCGGEYSARINERKVGDDSCPYCSGRSILPGYNDLATTDPQLAKEWSPNNEMKVTEVRKTMTYTTLWVCPTCHGEYKARICDREVGDDSCPYCDGRRTLPGYNDLATTDPGLAAEWSSNNERDIKTVRKSTKALALWICPTCGGEYSALISVREVGDNSCPFCNGYRVLPGYNDLATTDPELAKEWSPNNDRDVTTVKKTFTAFALWRCPTCGGDYNARISDREVGDDSCPYCAGRSTLPGFNDLETTNPDLAKEWSPNNEKKVTEVRKSLTYMAQWVCPTCHGEYQARICDREVGDDSCPYCNGRKVLPGYNSLKVRRPDMMADWLDAENALMGIDPDEVMETSKTIAWWQCSKCGYKYPMAIKDKAMKIHRRMESCPRCRGRRVKFSHYI